MDKNNALGIRDTSVLELIYEFIPTDRRNVHQSRIRWKANTHKDGTSQDGLSLVVDNYVYYIALLLLLLDWIQEYNYDLHFIIINDE